MMKKILRNFYISAARRFYGKHMGRFPFVKALNTYLRSTLIVDSQPQSTQIEGHTIFLDELDSLSLSVFGFYEPDVTALFRKYLKPGDIVVDIGANIGYFTLLAAKLVEPVGKVFAFEPEPTTFALLQKNVEINQYRNITVTQSAVVDYSGTVPLFISPQNRGGHSLQKSENQLQPIIVRTTTLDSFFRQYSIKVDFIKMDIEGAEGLALGGMSEVLSLNPTIKIVTEFAPQALRNCGTDPVAFLETLIAKRFRIYTSDLSKELHPDTLVNSMTTNDISHINICCVRD